jgi:hypothetical protein
MARLLVCRACGTMNRMRDYNGPPEYDMELVETIERHMDHSRRPAIPDAHPSQLFRVSDEEAALLDLESTLVQRLSDEQVFIKEIRDDLKVEALRCFSQHHRPAEGCPDWKSESKVVGRKKGVPPPYRTYLCEVCPVASHVEFKTREKSGYYN